jgi:hypothetical protein
MRSFWARIPPEVKLAAFSLVVVGVAVVLWREPSPSTNTPQQSIAKTPLQPVPVLPPDVLSSPLPQEGLPSPIYPLPQLSPPLEGLGKDPLLNPSPLPEVPLPDPLLPSSPSKSLNLPLSVSPSPGKIPNQKTPKGTKSTGEPSPSASVPVIPPGLLSPSPVPLPSSLGSLGDKKAPLAETADKNTNTNKNSIITEVRNYFKKGWKPPSDLKQDLNYSILLNADGSIEQIQPLSNAATEYIDRTNIPLPGSPLVTPVEEGGKTGINLVLTRDGTVKASLEEVKVPSSSSKSPREDSSNSRPREARP